LSKDNLHSRNVTESSESQSNTTEANLKMDKLFYEGRSNDTESGILPDTQIDVAEYFKNQS